MIDIERLRQDPEGFKKAVARKGQDIDVHAILTLDETRRELIGEIDTLRHTSNELAAKGADITEEDKKEGKHLKEQIKVKEEELENVEKQLHSRVQEVPNPPLEDVPSGREEDKKILREWGDVRQVSFSPKDHLELGTALELIDFEAGAKVAGSQFYYLTNEAALLELALVRYAMDTLYKKGFIPVITPDLVRERFYKGTGYMPKGEEAQTYEIEGEDLGLIATAEVTMAGYHADEVFGPEDLPKKYVALSHCFRKEGGAYGKYSKGLYRVHQFTKVEMFAYVLPEESAKTHEEFIGIEEEIYQELGIPHRVVILAAEDTGSQAAKTYDVEAWMPGRGEWGEITSTSNTTDYQARNMNIRYRTDSGTAYVHMLNGTAIATSRAPIAILENYQREDGGVDIPKALHPYLPFKSIEPRN